MSNEVQLIDFRNHTGKLRKWALHSGAAATNVTQNDRVMGILASMDQVRGFLMSGHEAVPDVIVQPYTAKRFYETVRKTPSIGPNEIHIACFRQNKESVGTALAVVSKTFWDTYLKNLPPPPTQSQRVAAGTREYTNVDIATELTRPWKTLQSELGTMAAIAETGAICYRRDGKIAAVDNQTALRLKEHLFNGRFDIISEWKASDVRGNLGAVCESITSRESFIRIVGAEYPGSHDTQQLCTLIDGLSSEFLLLKQGAVHGIDTRDALSYRFPIKATICTDFAAVTKIRIGTQTHSQWSLIKKAFEQSGERSTPISMQGVSLKPQGDKRVTTPDVRKSSNFSFTTQGEVQFRLTKNGALSQLRLHFNDQPGLCAMTALTPEHLEFDSDHSHRSHQSFLYERG